MLERVHVREVGADEGPLELAVQRVDERLDLLLSRASRSSPCSSAPASLGLSSIPRRSERKSEGTVIVATTSPFRSWRAASSRESRTSLTFWLTRRDRRVYVEVWPARVTCLREARLVDQRDARLRARVPATRPDEQRDHERIRDERPEEDGRPPEDEEVLADDEGGRPHTSVRASSVRSYSSSGPSKASTPSSRTKTRSAWPSSSSWFCVANTTAPPRCL